MALKKGVEVKPAKGKLGILLPGMGAVATTFIAGVQAIRRGIGKPIPHVEVEPAVLFRRRATESAR